ncbi:MAG: putative ABC transporter permease [Peptococcaceae bacterium]|nr:putative ABC transporter permease [Peptococcaceae bacterium]
MERLKEYFAYFMMYSVIGWCYEVFLEVVVYHWGFSNRGVLWGPYCPVYGVGALAFIFCFRKRMKKRECLSRKLLELLLVGVGCMIVATGIELAASYLLEALTGAWPWQTYADYRYHFQARIALSPSVRFGIGGVIFLYILQPILEKLVQHCPAKVFNRCVYALAAIMAADGIFTAGKLFR